MDIVLKFILVLIGTALGTVGLMLVMMWTGAA